MTFASRDSGNRLDSGLAGLWRTTMQTDWGSLFKLTLSTWEHIVRGNITYGFILILLRLAGRREFGSEGLDIILHRVMMAHGWLKGLQRRYQNIQQSVNRNVRQE